MKKLLLFLLLSFTIGHAQNVVIINHVNYTTLYNKSLHYPIMVEWWETKKKSECPDKLVRSNDFKPDPKLPIETDVNSDYVLGNKLQKSKGLKTLDRGHMCPARVNLCLGTSIENECFYFSNITPQYHALNAGDWKILETLTYDNSIKNDSTHVWAGSLGVAMKIGKVSVPKQCWKVIYIKKTNQYSAYLFNNDTSKSNGIEDNKVNIEVIQKLTGLKFK